MSDLNSIINVQISRQTQAVAVAAFNIPMILASFTNWSDRARQYTSLTGVAADFAVGSNVYEMAEIMFGQALVPTTIVVGRRQVDSTTGSVVTVANSTVYTLTINGVAVTFTSASSGATAINIVAGLHTAFTGSSITGVTFTDHLDGTFTLAVSVAGSPWSAVATTTNLNLVNVTPTETWVSALNAIENVNNNWFGVVCESHLSADQQAIAGYIETQNKIYLTSTSDVNAGTSATTDIGSVLQALTYVHTGILWNALADTTWPEAGWMAYQLQPTPGSNTWAYKTITGATPDLLTATQTQYLSQKNYNTYETLGGVNVTTNGKMIGGEFIDVMVLVFWCQARIKEDIWSALVNSPKIPYTAAGLTVIETKIRNVLLTGVTNGGFSATPKPIVNMPTIAQISTSDKAARRVSGITFQATLAGAIHYTTIQGYVVLPS